MPYSSLRQQKYFNANREKLEAEGVDVDEWNASTKGKDIPKKASKKTGAANEFAEWHDLSAKNPDWTDEQRRMFFSAWLGKALGEGKLPKKVKSSKFLGFIPTVSSEEADKAYARLPKTAAVLYNVLLLNNFKHAMDSMGLKPATMTPETMKPPGSGDRPKPRLGIAGPLEQTRLPSKPPVKETPALETEKTPEQIALEAGEKAGFKPMATGSVLMPSTGQ